MFKKNLAFIIVVIFAIVYAFIFSYYSILRHNNFYSGYDLSNFDHTIWNTLHGRFFQLTVNGSYVSRLSIHADFILIPLSLLYLIWDNVKILLIFQSIVFAIGSLAVFLIAKKILKNPFAGVLMALTYLINPAIEWANLYDFHPVVLSVPLLLFAIYFLLSKNKIIASILLFFAILTKENVSLLIFCLGLWLLIFQSEKKYGIILSALSLIYFFLVVFVLMPIASPGHINWTTRLYNLSSEDTENIGTMSSVVQYRLFSDLATFRYAKQLLGPFFRFSAFIAGIFIHSDP